MLAASEAFGSQIKNEIDARYILHQELLPGGMS